MGCKIILKLGGKDTKDEEIEEKDNQELSSLQEISLYIINNWDKNRITNLLNKLIYNPVILTDNLKLFLGKLIIGNVSLDTVINLFPNEMELINKIPDGERPTEALTLIDGAYNNGKPFAGRVHANGITTFVIRNKWDALLYARTEYLKYLLSKCFINGEFNINSDRAELFTHLKEVYENKLKIIVENLDTNIKKRIEDEIGLVNIQSIIQDYLNYKSSYPSDIINNKGVVISPKSVLNDFCRELNLEPVYYEESESNLARHLRTLHWKRTEFGKEDFYNAVNLIGNASQKEALARYSLLLFIDLLLTDMNNLIIDLFKDDLILKSYIVESVESTNDTELPIRKDTINKLIKETSKSQGEQFDLSKFSIEEINELLEYLNLISYEIDGEKVSIKVKKNNKGEFKFFHVGKKISNNEKIILKRKGKTLSEEFGYNTYDLFQPIEENDGKYLDYYIYKYTNDKNEDTFIISKNVLFPEMYDPPKFRSLKEAKQMIETFTNSAIIKKGSSIEMLKKFREETSSRYITTDLFIQAGSTISARVYPIQSTTTLGFQEADLYNTGKIITVVEHYKKLFGIDISALKTPEDIAIFLFKSTELGITSEQRIQEVSRLEKLGKDSDKGLSLNQKMLEDSNKLLTIVSEILEAPIKHHYVERVVVNNTEESDKKSKRTIYLKSLENYLINSTGRVVDGDITKEPNFVLTASLENLKKTLEATLFKGSGIQILIKSKQEVLEEVKFDNKPVFSNIEELEKIRGFVHNNNIYLIKENSDISDMLHETLHIVLGVLKIDNIKIYENILNQIWKNKKASSLKRHILDKYKNLHELDQKEELAVAYFARLLENNSIFYENNLYDSIVTNMFDKLKHVVKKELKKDFPTDLGFSTNSQQLIKNRQTTNLIADNIKKGIITKDC